MIRFSSIITILLVAFVAAGEAQARDQFRNGFIDRSSDTFVWNKIGGDPLRRSWESTLGQDRVSEVVPARVRVELISRMRVARRGAASYEVQNNDRFDLMFSGRTGWVAHNVLADTTGWTKSKWYWVVYYTDSVTGVQYIFYYFEGCGNLGLTVIGAPVQCRCEPAAGDACSQE